MKQHLWFAVWVISACTLWGNEFEPFSAGRIAVSGNETRLAVASDDMHIRVWDLGSRKLIHDISVAQPGWSVALDQSGEKLAIGTDGTRESANEYKRSRISLWDIRAATPALLWEKQVIGGCQAIAFAPSEKWLAAICTYSRLCFLDVENGSLLKVLTEDGNGYWDLAITDDEKMVVTAGQFTRFWNIENGINAKTTLEEDHWITSEESEKHQKLKAWSGGISVAISSQGDRAYVLGFFHGNSGRAEDCAEFNLRMEGVPRIVAASINKDDSRPTSLALSHDDKTLAFGMSDGRIELRNTAGEIVGEMKLPNPAPIRDLKFLNQSKELVVVTMNGAEVHIMNMETKSPQERLLPQ
ncbi:MAG: hypothetical protein JNK90_24235 [Planctomycetaceae bacterium]|nr:hypothetical protein [Planctomycetaceae bacterium]